MITSLTHYRRNIDVYMIFLPLKIDKNIKLRYNFASHMNLQYLQTRKIYDFNTDNYLSFYIDANESVFLN